MKQYFQAAVYHVRQRQNTTSVARQYCCSCYYYYYYYYYYYEGDIDVDERMLLKWVLQIYKHMDWIHLAHDRNQQSISLWSISTSILGAWITQSVQWLRYALDGPGFKTRNEQEIFPISKTSKPALGPTHRSFLGVKRPGRDADHSSPTSAEVKDGWSYTSTPTICLHGVDRNNVI